MVNEKKTADSKPKKASDVNKSANSSQKSDASNGMWVIWSVE